MQTNLEFETRCGCHRSIIVEGMFHPPRRYLLPLMPKGKVTVKSYSEEEGLQTRPEHYSRSFILERFHVGELVAVAYYREE